jgi:hypothetical protein
MVPMIRINIEDRLEVRISDDGIGFEPDNMSEEDWQLAQALIQQVIYQRQDLLGLNSPPGVFRASALGRMSPKPVTTKPAAKPRKRTRR